MEKIHLHIERRAHVHLGILYQHVSTRFFPGVHHADTISGQLPTAYGTLSPWCPGVDVPLFKVSTCIVKLSRSRLGHLVCDSQQPTRRAPSQDQRLPLFNQTLQLAPLVWMMANTKRATTVPSWIPDCFALDSWTASRTMKTHSTVPGVDGVLLHEQLLRRIVHVPGRLCAPTPADPMVFPECAYFRNREHNDDDESDSGSGLYGVSTVSRLG